MTESDSTQHQIPVHDVLSNVLCVKSESDEQLLAVSILFEKLHSIPRTLVGEELPDYTKQTSIHNSDIDEASQLSLTLYLLKLTISSLVMNAIH